MIARSIVQNNVVRAMPDNNNYGYTQNITRIDPHKISQDILGAKRNLFVSCMKLVITTSTMSFLCDAYCSAPDNNKFPPKNKNKCIMLIRDPHKTSQGKLIEAYLMSDSSVTGIGGFCMSR